MRKYQRLTRILKTPQHIVSLILFLVIFIVYGSRVSETFGFWDSAEFAISNQTLQASHPAGAPLYTLLSSIILCLFPKAMTAYVCNLISAFFGAVTITLLFKIICISVLKLKPRITGISIETTAISAGLLGSLSLAFSDSFWTAAIETEVYTLSFAMMCLLIYLALLWHSETNLKKQNKLILLFFFCFGLSISVHLILASILVPLSVLVISKKYIFNFKNVLTGLVVSLLLFVITYGFLIKGIISITSIIDIYFVNNFDFGVNISALTFLILFLAILIIVSIVASRKKQYKLHFAALILLFFYVGLGSYLLPMIRSNINTLVAESVKTPQKLNAYMSGERFGVNNIPLIYGPTYNAQLDTNRPFTNISPKYSYSILEDKYIKVHDGLNMQVNYSYKFKMLFPRVYDAKNEANYKAWTTIKGEPVKHLINGEVETFMKPKFSESFKFFINYQLVWLNLRYLLWNFAGKQNDIHGLGYTKNGNWQSGIHFLDKKITGDRAFEPEFYKKNRAKNFYYFIPLILGFLGLFALRKAKALFWSSIFLFFTFGLGITIYVNPLPSSILVRERDYIFIGAFIIFAFWIGLSLIFFLEILSKYKKSKLVLGIAILVLFIASPLQLFAKGSDNHNNSKDQFAYQFAKAYLDSCPLQTILITNGDNMTFPLWYLQQVENYRTDVRVINFDQLNIDSHINNLKKKLYNSEPIAIDLNESLYIDGVEKLLPFKEDTKDAVDISILTNFLNAENTLTEWNGRPRHYIPSQNLEFNLDSTIILKKFKKSSYNTGLVNKLRWHLPKDFYGLNDIILLNIIKNNFEERPIAFAINARTNHYLGLDNYTVQNGMIALLRPELRKSKNQNPKIVNTKKTYEVLVEKTDFTNLKSSNDYIKDENRTYAQQILRQNYYFLAQALVEEKQLKRAKNVLDKCELMFPNKTVPYKEFSFAIGKLYARLGFKKKGISICKISLKNTWDEIQWMTSINPPNPTINVRHATKLMNNYKQMLEQISLFNADFAKDKQQQFIDFSQVFKVWQDTNWPY